MSKRPADPDPRRLQGVPRILAIQKPANTFDAEDAIFLATSYRLVPDPWQCEVIHAWMGRRPDGRWVHPRCGLAVPRQNGKNGSLEVRELFGLIELGEAILHTAHQVNTALKAFERIKHFFGERPNDPDAKFPELNALLAETRSTNGQHGLFLKDVWRVDGQLVRSIGRPVGVDVEYVARGGFIEFRTRTGRGARGTTYDLLVVDEAQHLTDEQLAAVRPTISSGALGNSQVIYLGTPPDPERIEADGTGQAWARLRARAGKAKNLAWIEYGAPDGPLPDVDDLALLYASNPSLGVRHGNGAFGLDFETVDGEKDELSAADYARERLGWWGNPEAKSHRGVIDMDQWRTLRAAGDQLPSRGLIVVDVAPDLAWTTVALITDGPEGRPLALVDRHEGTSWVIRHDENDVAVGRIPQLVADLSSVLEVALTPSAHIFAAALIKAGVEHEKLTAGQVGAGCTAFQQMVTDSEMWHVGQPTLDIAAKQAITKYVGDTQQWDRRKRKVDISPLVAVSVGVHRWALKVAKPKGGVPRRRTAEEPARRRPAAAEPPVRRTRRRGGGGFDPRSSGF